MYLLAMVKMFAEELRSLGQRGVTGMIWGYQPRRSELSWGSREVVQGSRVAGVAPPRARGSRAPGSSQLWRLALPVARVHEPRAANSRAQHGPGSVGGRAHSLLGTPGLLGSGPRGCRPSPRHATANGGPVAPARARRALRSALATPRGPGRTLGWLAGRTAGGAPQESPRRGHAA